VSGQYIDVELTTTELRAVTDECLTTDRITTAHQIIADRSSTTALHAAVVIHK